MAEDKALDLEEARRALSGLGCLLDIARNASGGDGGFVGHAALAALYAYALAAREGLDAEAAMAASVLSDVASRLGGGRGGCSPGVAILPSLLSAGCPPGLAERVEAVEMDERLGDVLVDADSLAKFTLHGFYGLVARRMASGRDFFAAVLEAASRELTAAENTACMFSSEAARREAERLAARLRGAVEALLEEAGALGLEVERRSISLQHGRAVLLRPKRCPLCGSELEEATGESSCGGVEAAYRCPRCGWYMAVTVCPPPRCRRGGGGA